MAPTLPRSVLAQPTNPRRAFNGTRALSAMVYGISAYDPFTYAGVAVALALVAAIACYIPALRASRVNPVITLREE